MSWSEVENSMQGKNTKYSGTQSTSPREPQALSTATHHWDPRSVWVAAITKASHQRQPLENCIRQNQYIISAFRGMVFVPQTLSLSFADQCLFPSVIHCLHPLPSTSCSAGAVPDPPHKCGAAQCLPACTRCLEWQTWRETTAMHGQTDYAHVTQQMYRCVHMSICAGNLTLWVLLPSPDMQSN